MKNLYPKGKGKIHPAGDDALAVLNLLPAAILALTALLCAEDREVLAYLVTRSLKGPCSLAAEEKRRCRRGVAAATAAIHRPAFDCGCFECYTSFWFRWDSSPDRELINQAIEAFEEHLASSEQQQQQQQQKSPPGAAAGKGGCGRRRDRRLGDRATVAAAEKNKAGKEEKMRKKQEETVEKDSSGGGELEEVEVVEQGCSGVGEVGGEREEEVTGSEVEMAAGNQQQQKQQQQEVEEEEAAESGGERRRAWADVMGLFNSRLWSLWVPDL